MTSPPPRISGDPSLHHIPPQSLEAEESILSACLLSPESCEEIIDLLRPDNFYRSAHIKIFTSIIELHNKKQPADLVTLTNRLRENGHLEEIGGASFLASLVDEIPMAVNVVHYAEIIRDKAAKRLAIQYCNEITQNCFSDNTPAAEIIDTAQNKILSIDAINPDKVTYRSMEDILMDGLDTLDDRFLHKGQLTGVPTGFSAIDELTWGLQPTDLIIIAARPSMGKSQPLFSKILLPDGSWKLMGDIKRGDKIASVDGSNSSVINVFPQGIRPIFEIELSDGRKVLADREHLWMVTSSRWKGNRVLSTQILNEKINTVRHKDRTHIIKHSGEFGFIDDIGIDPWLLGFLLGDGCLTRGACFSNPEKYIQDRVVLASGLEIHKATNKKECHDYTIFHGKNKPNPIKEALRVLGVMGLLSYEKFIPKIVFRSNKHMREMVLAGLLESDGWIEKFGSVQFSTSSRQLSKDVIELIQSVSGSARLRIKTKVKYSYKDEIKTGKPAFIVSVAFDSINKIIKSPRLLKNMNVKRKRDTSPTIKSIEHVGNFEAQCISVSHPSGLYITDGYIVTHNTSLALNIARHASIDCIEKPCPVGIFSMEMSEQQLLFKFMADLAKINTQKFKSGLFSKDEWIKLTAAAGRMSDAPIHIDDNPGLTIYDVRRRARQMKKKEDIKLIIIDYIQLMSGSGKESRNMEINEISTGLKNLAKELEIPVIALSQLNRKVEDRPDKKPRLADLRDSGSLEQDADVIMFIYRDEVYNKDENNPEKGTAEIIISKNRTGPIGFAKLAFINKLASFYELARNDY